MSTPLFADPLTAPNLFPASAPPLDRQPTRSSNIDPFFATSSISAWSTSNTGFPVRDSQSFSPDWLRGLVSKIIHCSAIADGTPLTRETQELINEIETSHSLMNHSTVQLLADMFVNAEFSSDMFLMGLGHLRTRISPQAYDMFKEVIVSKKFKTEALSCGNQASPLNTPPQNRVLSMPETLVVVQTSPNSFPLHEAVFKGDIISVQTLLQQGSQDVNRKDASGNTPIFYANKAPMIRFLLNAGAIIQVKQATPIPEIDKRFKKAIEEADIVAIKDFLMKGMASIHVKFGSDLTPLHIAAQSDDSFIVLLLLRAGGNIEARCDQAQTPLHYAALNKKLDNLKLLLQEGANVNAINKFRETALHVAATKGDELTVSELLAKGASVNVVCLKGCTPFIYAVSGETPFPKVMKLLIERGANVRAKANGVTAFHYAAKFEEMENWVEQFLKAGLSIDVADDGGLTPFHWAARAGCFSMMGFLADRKAKYELRTVTGNTALHLASKKGALGSIDHLITHFHFDVNSMNGQGATPLHLASEAGKKQAVIHLLQHGANINAKDSREQTSLSLASQKGLTEVVQCLLHRGAKPNLGNSSGTTPLHYAVHAGHVETARALIQHGADVNAEGRHRVTETYGTLKNQQIRQGVTPLHMAALVRNNLGIVQLLLQSRADATAKDSAGKQPHQYAGHSPGWKPLFDAAHKDDCCVIV